MIKSTLFGILTLCLLATACSKPEGVCADAHSCSAAIDGKCSQGTFKELDESSKHAGSTSIDRGKAQCAALGYQCGGASPVCMKFADP